MNPHNPLLTMPLNPGSMTERYAKRNAIRNTTHLRKSERRLPVTWREASAIGERVTVKLSN